MSIGEADMRTKKDRSETKAAGNGTIQSSLISGKSGVIKVKNLATKAALRRESPRLSPVLFGGVQLSLTKSISSVLITQSYQRMCLQDWCYCFDRDSNRRVMK